MTEKPLFSKLFRQSPVAAISDHMAVCSRCAQALPGYLETVLQGDWDGADRLIRNIQQLEQEADELKKQLRLNLPRGIFLSVPRDDVLELLRAQDQLANTTRDVAGIILGRKMTFPDSLHASLMTYVKSSSIAARKAEECVLELDEILQAGFGTGYISRLETALEELDKTESQSDDLQVALRHDLFRLESGLDPVAVMFLYRVIDLIGDIADHAERVGNRLTLLVAR